MTLTQSLPLSSLSLMGLLQRFVILTFSLTVCWLVVGFPVVALLVIGTSLVAISLQAVLPISSIVVVAGIVLAVNVAAIIMGAALLTAWGIYPDQMSVFWWLKSKVPGTSQATFACCPLTCETLFCSISTDSTLA